MGIFDKSFHAVLLLHCFVAVGEPRLCGENRIEGLMHRVTELLLDIVRKATWYWAGRSSSNDLGGGDGANHLSVSLKNPPIFLSGGGQSVPETLGFEGEHLNRL